MATAHSSDQKLRNFRPPYLTKNIIIREYLNLGNLSQFLLNHFDSEKLFLINCPNSSRKNNMIERDGGVCRKHNMIDRDDVSVESTMNDPDDVSVENTT